MGYIGEPDELQEIELEPLHTDAPAPAEPSYEPAPAEPATEPASVPEPAEVPA